MHELSTSYHSHGPGSITLINWSSLSQTKVSKTSAIPEKVTPVTLFQTKQKIQTTITKLPICREWHACLFVADAAKVPELSWFTDTIFNDNNNNKYKTWRGVSVKYQV